MNYVSMLKFEESADFDHLKNLVLRAAQQANLDIFDDIFDWNIILTYQQYN